MGVAAARRFVMAAAFGGCTTADAYDIIADADARPYGTAAELIDPGDLPDRWFRDAWRRSPNGGPIDIDRDAARDVQMRHILIAVQESNRRERLRYRPRLIELDEDDLRHRIGVAPSLAALRAVWPTTLSARGFPS
jgi:hypothetical protein